MNHTRPKLIMIGGPPWVGKTTCARELFTSLDNSAWLDGDDVWRVNPFSVQDPRLRNSDKNMAFVLNTYLESQFDYVIFSSVVLTDKLITRGILDAISVREYDMLFFILTASPQVLLSRSQERDNVTSPDPRFSVAALAQDAIQIDTTALTPVDVAAKILSIVRDPASANLMPVVTDGIREWGEHKSQGVKRS